MPAPRDFRTVAFAESRVERCGKYIGRYSYWKLYVIENTLRVVLHSVLSKQIPAGWWTAAVDPKLQKKATDVRATYAKKPWHTPAGSHDIYYVFLPDINKIMSATSHLLRPTIPDIDAWIARIEDVRVPRNLVGHMNLPHRNDRQRIDTLHQDVGKLIEQLQTKGISVQVP